MNRIVLVSCATTKLDRRAKAEDLYVSDLFRKSFAYARSLRPAAIFILSAKHGLVHPEDVIEPYNQTLNTMNPAEIISWSDSVLCQLRKQTDVQDDHFIFLAGDRYRRYLTPRLCSVEVPMQGLRIGEQLRWLNRRRT